jgi:uncharacterized membrane protein
MSRPDAQQPRRRPRDRDPQSESSHDRFGRVAEQLVRAFGMPWFLAGQTAVIVAWVITNALAGFPHFDPYPFIFLNLLFSALAAYAAPFVLLAESRQAERDRAHAEAEERHHDELRGGRRRCSSRMLARPIASQNYWNTSDC